MFCPSCGAEVSNPDDRFCQHCGNPLTHAAETPNASSDPTETASNGETFVPPQPPPITSPYESYPSAPQWTDQSTPMFGVPLSPFGVPLARWWQRVGAMLLDTIIVGVPLLVVGGIVSANTGHHRVTSYLFALLGGIYFAYFNGMGTGQTLGNRAPGIAVRDVHTGEAIGFGRGLLRWFVRTVLYAAFILPGLINDLFPIWDKRHQSIADKAARSVVIQLQQ